MFDIGFAELLLIGLIALIVIGPKRLPESARFLGYWIGKLRRTIGDARQEMEREFGIDEIKREVHNTLLLEQLDKERRQVEEQFSQVRNETEHKAPDNSDQNTEPSADSWLQEDMDFIDDELIDQDSGEHAQHGLDTNLADAATDQPQEPGVDPDKATK